MKHLLILISILLLSSPVIGNNHKGETLYQWGECCSDYVWKGFGDKDTHPVYKGEVENGVPNGLGGLISTNGWKYFGRWKNGEIWNGTEYDNYGNIIYRWVNGKRKYHNLYKKKKKTMKHLLILLFIFLKIIFSPINITN